MSKKPPIVPPIEQKALGIIRTDDEIADALMRAGGVMSDAAKLLGCCRQTIASRVKLSERLQEIRDNEKQVVVDEAHNTLVGIMRTQRHPRQFDAAKFLAERLDKDTYGASLNVKAQHSVNPSGTVNVPMDQRTFQPEAWDADEHARFLELMAIAPYDWTIEQYQEVQELKRKARVIELSPDDASVKPTEVPKLSAPVDNADPREPLDDSDEDT